MRSRLPLHGDELWGDPKDPTGHMTIRGRMQRLLVVLIVVLVGSLLRAQGRHASVQLDDGEVIKGSVLAMDLSTLRIQVGHDVRTIEATRIRSCRFEGSGAAGDSPAPPATNATESPLEAPAKQVTAPQDPAPAAAPPKARWQRPPDPIDPNAEPPHDLRRSRLRHRLEALDERYPWLAPAAPSQWLSLGLLLGISLVLTVHVSARVAGSENPSLGRSSAMGVWYLLTTFLQIAAVPVNDLTVVLMLLGNTTLALFWLRGLFGLARVGALIAFAVQLGFFVLGYGALELIDALLGSIVAPGA